MDVFKTTVTDHFLAVCATMNEKDICLAVFKFFSNGRFTLMEPTYTRVILAFTGNQRSVPK